MAALVENMFYVREVPWHGLGVRVEEAPTSSEAIELAGLNWTVKSEPIFDGYGKEIQGYKANIRDSDNTVLGIVSNRYKIIQNSEAFSFTDSLIGDGVTYETAGSLRDGKQIWLLAKMPSTQILDDEIEPYLCFTNTHDGTGAVRVCMTPVRVVCNNTLNFALDTAKRAWSTRHTGNIESKLQEAKETLTLAQVYMDNLGEEANKLADKKLSEAELEAIFDCLFPINREEDTQRKINNILQMKEQLFQCYKMPDISQYKGTAWGAAMAVTDMADHMAPTRLTNNYAENNWSKIMNGHPFVDQMFKRIAA